MRLDSRFSSRNLRNKQSEIFDRRKTSRTRHGKRRGNSRPAFLGAALIAKENPRWRKEKRAAPRHSLIGNRGNVAHSSRSVDYRRFRAFQNQQDGRFARNGKTSHGKRERIQRGTAEGTGGTNDERSVHTALEKERRSAKINSAGNFTD